MPGSRTPLHDDLADLPSELGESPVLPNPITGALAVHQALMPAQESRAGHPGCAGQFAAKTAVVPQEGVGRRQTAAQDSLSAMIEAEAEAAAAAAYTSQERGQRACLQNGGCLSV